MLNDLKVILKKQKIKGTILLILTTPNKDFNEKLKKLMKSKTINKSNLIVLTFFKFTQEDDEASIVSLPQELDATSFILLLENFILKIKPSAIFIDSTTPFTEYLSEDEKKRFIKKLNTLAVENNVKLVILT